MAHLFFWPSFHPSSFVRSVRDIFVTVCADSNRRSSNGTAEHKLKPTKLAHDELTQQLDCQLGVCEPLNITCGTEKRPSVDVPSQTTTKRIIWSTPGIVLVSLCFVFRTWSIVNPTTLYGQKQGVETTTSVPCVLISWLVVGAGLMWLFGRDVRRTDVVERSTDMEAGTCQTISPQDLTTQCPNYTATNRSLSMRLLISPTAPASTNIQPTFGKTSSNQRAAIGDQIQSASFGKTPSNQRAAIGDQTQSASTVDTTSTSSGDDTAAVGTTAVKEVWYELSCNHDPPSFLEDSAITLLRAKVKDLVPIAAPNLELKRLDICNWVDEQCQARHAPVTTAFITMQLFDSCLGAFRFGAATPVYLSEAALLLVSSLSIALKHDQRDCSLCASDCALMATQHFLNSQKQTFSSKDVAKTELAVLFETKFTFLLTPIAAAEYWGTVIGLDCRIGDSSTEAGAKMQRTFLKLVAMDAVPPNLPAGALGGAVVLAELYYRTFPASVSDTDERVELLQQGMAELYSRHERENATALLIAAEARTTVDQPAVVIG
jgi:hypothetical protein